MGCRDPGEKCHESGLREPNLHLTVGHCLGLFDQALLKFAGCGGVRRQVRRNRRVKKGDLARHDISLSESGLLLLLLTAWLARTVDVAASKQDEGPRRRIRTKPMP